MEASTNQTQFHHRMYGGFCQWPTENRSIQFVKGNYAIYTENRPNKVKDGDGEQLRRHQTTAKAKEDLMKKDRDDVITDIQTHNGDERNNIIRFDFGKEQNPIVERRGIVVVGD
ncbi:hypothetical protein QL285_095184 [Trifolium repens]|jgi:hypothetical protein|nr:hypothetical protein QL285_095184 [Trifolium repens]